MWLINIPNIMKHQRKTVYRFGSVGSSDTEHREDRTSGQGRSANDERQVEAVDLVQHAAEERPDHQTDAEHRLHHRQHR